MRSRVDQFAELVARQPDNELFRFSLAQALAEAGRADDAIPHYEFCVARKADWMMPRILLGKLLLAAGRKDAARPLLSAALDLAVAQNHETPESELRALLSSFA
jgi:predicted Zn-dependent protease